MADAGRLLLHGRDHRGVAVAQRRREDAREGIQVLAPVEVPDPAALALGDRQGLLVERNHAVEDVLPLLGKDSGAAARYYCFHCCPVSMI